MADLSDRELLEALDLPPAPRPARARTAREERIIAGFEDIARFRQTHGRAPLHGEDRDIFERIYAVRLDRLRAQADCLALLRDRDDFGLLQAADATHDAEPLDDAALLAELGGAAPAAGGIERLVHVAPRAERRAADAVASHTRCVDFDRFRPLFAQAEAELRSGVREARPFGRDAAVASGDFFILGGQTVYVAGAGEPIRAPNGESDARLRVIYANGTESNLLRRSLQRALYKDAAGRRLTEPDLGPLFGAAVEAGDLASGTIYVLRSRSTHPTVAAHRELVHKIGFTGGPVAARIAGAEADATYLLAGVDLVAEYRLFNIDRAKLEALLHRVFAKARLELTIQDRFGHPVQPREWFLVPLQAIDAAVARVRDGSITGYAYDPAMGSLTRAA